jgi:hypothetical protein
MTSNKTDFQQAQTSQDLAKMDKLAEIQAQSQVVVHSTTQHEIQRCFQEREGALPFL